MSMGKCGFFEDFSSIFLFLHKKSSGRGFSFFRFLLFLITAVTAASQGYAKELLRPGSRVQMIHYSIYQRDKKVSVIQRQRKLPKNRRYGTLSLGSPFGGAVKIGSSQPILTERECENPYCCGNTHPAPPVSYTHLRAHET